MREYNNTTLLLKQRHKTSLYITLSLSLTRTQTHNILLDIYSFIYIGFEYIYVMFLASVVPQKLVFLILVYLSEIDDEDDDNGGCCPG